jgi:hypothetical protein
MLNRISGADPGAEPGASTREPYILMFSGGGDTGSTHVIKVQGSFAMVPTSPGYIINANKNTASRLVAANGNVLVLATKAA